MTTREGAYQMEKDGQKAFLDHMGELRLGKERIGHTAINLTSISGTTGKHVRIGIANRVPWDDAIDMDRYGSR